MPQNQNDSAVLYRDQSGLWRTEAEYWMLPDDVRAELYPHGLSSETTHQLFADEKKSSQIRASNNAIIHSFFQREPLVLPTTYHSPQNYGLSLSSHRLNQRRDPNNPICHSLFQPAPLVLPITYHSPQNYGLSQTRLIPKYISMQIFYTSSNQDSSSFYPNSSSFYPNYSHDTCSRVTAYTRQLATKLVNQLTELQNFIYQLDGMYNDIELKKILDRVLYYISQCKLKQSFMEYKYLLNELFVNVAQLKAQLVNVAHEKILSQILIMIRQLDGNNDRKTNGNYFRFFSNGSSQRKIFSNESSQRKKAKAVTVRKVINSDSEKLKKMQSKFEIRIKPELHLDKLCSNFSIRS